MSKYSGQYDLADAISMEKTYPSPQNPNILISDEMECFEIFKKRTGGVIYQSIPVELTKKNINFFLKTDKNLDKNTENEYTYYSRTFKTLKELNKFGYYIKKPIKFDTLLDIIPYYPYTIALSYCKPEGEYVVISRESRITASENESYYYGYEYSSASYYREQLQKHYIEIVKKYY